MYLCTRDPITLSDNNGVRVNTRSDNRFTETKVTLIKNNFNINIFDMKYTIFFSCKKNSRMKRFTKEISMNL